MDKGAKVVFKDKYRREHESEFILFKAAEKSLKPFMKDGKPPFIKTLRTEINQLYEEKNSLKANFEQSKTEFAELQKVKDNVDTILGKNGSLDRENSRKRSEDLE